VTSWSTKGLRLPGSRGQPSGRQSLPNAANPLRARGGAGHYDERHSIQPLSLSRGPAPNNPRSGIHPPPHRSLAFARLSFLHSTYAIRNHSVFFLLFPLYPMSLTACAVGT
jgi:hypothetical protein